MLLYSQRQVIDTEKAFFATEYPWSIPDMCVDEILNRSDIERFRNRSRLSLAPHPPKQTKRIVELVSLGEILHDQFDDIFRVPFERVDNRVRAGVVGVCGLRPCCIRR